MTTCPLAPLFAQAQAELEVCRRLLANHGLHIDPATVLVRGEGLLFFYDPVNRRISLALPDTSTPIGVLQSTLMRTLLGCPDDAALARLISAILPWTLAHELGHALRHQYGQFGADPWVEEQVANLIAAALTRRRMAPAARDEVLALAHRALGHLHAGLEGELLGLASHAEAHQALGVAGVLRRSTVRSLEAIEHIFAVSSESVLREVHSTVPGAAALLLHRQTTIDAFNREYTASITRYAAFQLGWMVVELEGSDEQYVDDLAQRYLGRPTPVLPPLPALSPTPAESVQSAFQAWQRLREADHPAGGHLFYRRYRRLLLNFLAEQGGIPGGKLDREERRLAEDLDETDPGMLSLLGALAPEPARSLFPDRLSALPRPSDETLRDALPTPSDQGLFAEACGLGGGEAARETWERIRLLLGSPCYAALPAELLVALAHALLRLHLEPGEALAWQGRDDDDVFLVVRGRIEILVSPLPDSPGARLGLLGPGDVAGEVAFLSGLPRSATLLAVEPVECLVLRSLTLRLLGYAHPEFLTSLGRVLARRLAETNQRLLV